MEYLRKSVTAFRFFRREKHFSDLVLAVEFLRDLTSIYVRRPNDEVAYYCLLFSFALAAEPTTVVELGTGPGISSRAFLRVLKYGRRIGKRPTGLLHTCDLNPISLRRLDRFRPLVVPHLMSSDELALRWENDMTPIDLLFIDADHSHEQSMKDFQNFSKFVKPNGGIVLMHDTVPQRDEDESLSASGTVWRTAKSIKDHSRDQFEVSTFPHLNGITLIRKRGSKYF